MDSKSQLERFPDRITVRASDGLRFYARDSTLDAQFAEGEPPGAAPASLAAVYRAEAGGAPVIPTARVFILCQEPNTVADCRTEIESAGFEIERIPKSAPHGAWLIARSGRVIDAVLALGKLAEIEILEVVQPELVGEIEKR